MTRAPEARSLPAAVLLLSLLFAAPGAWAEVSGTVLELLNPEAPPAEWRRQPLSDAYVIMKWTVTIPAPGHATSSCRYSEIARTDGDGRYSMEGPNLLTAGFAEASGFVYSPGRDHMPGSDPWQKHFTMVKSTRPPDRRLETLSNIATPGCMDRKIHDPRGLLKAYLGSLLSEARTLNVQTRDAKRSMAALESAVKGADPAARQAPAPMKVVPQPGRIERAHPAPQAPAPAN